MVAESLCAFSMKSKLSSHVIFLIEQYSVTHGLKKLLHHVTLLMLARRTDAEKRIDTLIHLPEIGLWFVRLARFPDRFVNFQGHWLSPSDRQGYA